MIILYFLTGICIGSFVAAFTYRWPRGIPISKGRSFCDHCHKKIVWHDNIPLLSFLILKGRCRSCHKRYSLRYFIIEFFTGVLFVLTSLVSPTISSHLPYLSSTSFLFLPFLFFCATCLFTILITDWEHQLIPDELSFSLLAFLIVSFLLADFHFYEYLLSGVIFSVFLLIINMVTFGKGMGLGDVKLALFMGTALGFKLGLVWMLLSFVIGGFLGLILIISKSASLRDKIAFGPFMIVGFIATFFVGSSLLPFL